MTTRRSFLTGTLFVPAFVGGLSADLSPEAFGAHGDGVADDSTAFATMFAQASGKRVVCSPGRTYRISQTIQVTSRATVVATDATFLYVGQRSLFNLTGTTGVAWLGGTFELAKGNGGTGTPPIDCPAFQLRGTSRFAVKGATFRGPVGDKAIKESSAKGDPPSSLTVADCVFTDSASIWGGNVVDSVIDGCRWKGSHKNAVAINSDDHFGRLVPNLVVRNCSIEHTSYIAFEIKFATGLIFENVAVAGGGKMAVSLPNCRGGMISGCKISNFADSKTYGFELPGNCSGTTVKRCSFKNIAGTSVHFGMDTYGFAQNVTVTDNEFIDCVKPLVLFRPKRCLAVFLSAQQGSFTRGDHVDSDGRPFEVVGFDEDKKILYLIAVQSSPGRNVDKKSLASGAMISSKSTAASATVQDSKYVRGAGVDALHGWSRGVDVEVSKNTLTNSGPLAEFESGCLRTRWLANRSTLKSTAYHLIDYLGDDYMIEGNEQHWNRDLTPSGKGAIVGGKGAGNGTIAKNQVWAAGKGSFLFSGFGDQIVMQDNVAYDCPKRPFNYSSAEATFKSWKNNRSVEDNVSKSVESPPQI